MTLPEVVKKRMTKESTLQCGSVGGTSQGDHFTDITMDDIVGEQDLSAGRSSNVDMYRKANWIPYTERALVTTPNETRIGLRATRYAEDDAYEYITNNMGELICYDDEKRDYDVVKGGEWTVYWRFVKENGKIIFPERVTEEWLAKVEQTDPWFYWTQLENRPRKSGLNKFSSYTPRPFELIYDDDKGWILRYEDEYGVQITNPLGACDMVQAADPAATDTGITARTSRTATGCVAHAPDNKRFVFRVKAGYITPSVMYDELFENAGSFNNYLRASYLEAQGAFKVLVPPLREEERKRRRYLNLRPVSAVGNKDVRIENALDPVLRDNLLYVCTTDGSMDLFKEEYRGFPQAHKKDVLDMISLGLSSTVRPYSEDEELKKAEQYERFMTRSVNRAGY
uniref:Putative terminase n=1 Tax=viral metagenome TaxID=1070528 RepID=A0A6M3LBB7_9ZZZZ